MDTPRQTIVSQYAGSPVISALIDAANQWFDPGALLDAFVADIWELTTAQGIGLDIWGRIVGVGRVLQVASDKFLGFEEATSVSADPFNQSPLYPGGAVTGNYLLSDAGFRTLIYAKALANISDGSVPSINRILLTLFPGRGNCYVVDNDDMTMIYHFEFILTPVEAAIVQGSGVLPRPPGVSATVVQV